MGSNIELYNDILLKVSFFYKALKLNKHKKSKDRKLAISIQKIITLSIFKQQNGITTKLAMYNIFQLECSYKTMVVNMNILLAIVILTAIMKSNNIISIILNKHINSTDIPVCSNRKGKYHKTIQGFANWGYTGKGAFYGLKLHITTDLNKQMLGLRFSSGNVDDGKIFMDLNGVCQGDSQTSATDEIDHNPRSRTQDSQTQIAN